MWLRIGPKTLYCVPGLKQIILLLCKAAGEKATAQQGSDQESRETHPQSKQSQTHLNRWWIFEYLSSWSWCTRCHLPALQNWVGSARLLNDEETRNKGMARFRIDWKGGLGLALCPVLSLHRQQDRRGVWKRGKGRTKTAQSQQGREDSVSATMAGSALRLK